MYLILLVQLMAYLFIYLVIYLFINFILAVLVLHICSLSLAICAQGFGSRASIFSSL